MSLSDLTTKLQAQRVLSPNKNQKKNLTDQKLSTNYAGQAEP